jgi:ribosomal protein S18 acetylase RimI-like enzyme
MTCNSDLIFRDMEESDIGYVTAIISYYSKNDGESSEKYYRAYFERKKNDSGSHEFNFVICDPKTGRIMGMCGYNQDKYKTPGIYWLTWLYVNYEFCKGGVGTALLEKSIEIVRELGARKLYLDTGNESLYENAIRLYKRYGFKEEGRFLDYFGKDSHSVILALDFHV